MKHEMIAKLVLAEMHEPWMDAKDREEFDREMLAIVGDTLDAAIEEGFAEGHSEEQQIAAARRGIRLCRIAKGD